MLADRESCLITKNVARLCNLNIGNTLMILTIFFQTRIEDFSDKFTAKANPNQQFLLTMNNLDLILKPIFIPNNLKHTAAGKNNRIKLGR